MRHYLVVANQTLGLPQLTAKILKCAALAPAEFHLLVPATHAHDHARWTPAQARAIASRRLEGALRRLGELGVKVHGEVGDPSPMTAIAEVLRLRSFDELILSTLPPGPSRWLRQGLPERIEQDLHLPVIHVVAADERLAPL